MAHTRSLAGDIQQLRELLKEQYSDLASIVVEAAQNADDAKSTRMHLQLVQGIKTEHMLLRDPALVIINDGHFEQGDHRGICDLGFGTKGGSGERIGRFGLGLKSIYHLGECFWFTGSENQPGMNATRSADPAPWLLNPWWDEQRKEIWYAEWSEKYGKAERLLLQQRMQKVASTVGLDQQWFALWVPLRRNAHISNRNYLADTSWGDQLEETMTALVSQSTHDRIISTLPLLRHLRHISCNDDSPNSVPWSFELTETSDRRQEQTSIGTYSLNGSIEVHSPHGRHCVRYLGSEQRLSPDTTNIKKLVDQPSWPPAYKIVDGSVTTVKDRSDPHGAVIAIIEALPGNDHAEIVIIEAANTPLTDLTFTKQIDGEDNPHLRLQLVLHGEYFVDSGRRHLRLDNDTIQGQWNRTIKENITASLLIPVLYQALVTLHGDRPAITAVPFVKTLITSPMWQSIRLAACREQSLALMVTACGLQWQTFDSNRPQVSIPGQVESAQLFIDLPGIADVERQAVLVSAAAPVLSSQPPKPWSAEWVLALLSNPSPDIGKFVGSLQLLAAIIDRVKQDGGINDRTKPALITVVSLALGNQPERNLSSERKAAIQSLIAALPLETRWILNTTDLGAFDGRWVAQVLNEAMSKHLVIPGDLYEAVAGERINPSLSAFQVGSLIRRALAVDICQRDDKRSVARRTIRDFIDTQRDQANQLLSQIGELPWMKAAIGDGEMDWCNWGSIEQAFDTDTLLASSPLPEHRKRLTALVQALDDQVQLRVISQDDRELAGQLLGSNSSTSTIATCTEAKAASIVSQHQLTSDSGKRAVLLELMRGAPSELQRYLLHGTYGHRQSTTEPLLALTNRAGAGTLGKVLRQLLQRTQSEWTLLDPVVTSHLSPDDKQRLLIHDAEADAIRDHFHRDPASLKAVVRDCTDAERRELRQVIQDRSTALGLPIWETLDGRWIAIDVTNSQLVYQDRRRLLPSIGITASQLANATIIGWEDDPRVQDHLIVVVTELTAEDLVVLLLESDRPHRWFEQIIDLAQHAEMTTNTVKELSDRKPWIRLLDNTGAAPCDLVDCGPMESWVIKLRNEASTNLWTMSLMSKRDSQALTDGITRWNSASKRQQAAVMAIAEQVGQHQPWRTLQPLSGQLNLDDLLLVCRYVNEVPDSWRFLADIKQVLGRDEDADFILNTIAPKVRGGLSADAIKAYITGAERAWPEMGRDTQVALLKVIAWTLQPLDDASRSTALAGIRLPNASSVWTPTNNLCTHIPGARREQQLHPTIARAFQGNGQGNKIEPAPYAESRANAGYASFEEAMTATCLAVHQYFTPWRDLVPEQIIGGVIAMLSAYDAVCDEAKKWLGATWSAARKVRTELIGDQVNESIIVSILDRSVKTISCTAVDGSPMDASIEPDADQPNLLPDRRRTSDNLKTLRNADDQQFSTIAVRLRQVDPSTLTKDARLKALKDLVNGLAGLFWGGVVVSDYWQKLAIPHQRELQALQKYMLPKAIYQLETFKVRADSPIRTLLMDWRQLEYSRIDGDQEKRSDKEIDLLDRLYELMCDDASIEQEVLGYIRDHIGTKHYQYGTDSVPFELIQNADDAILEELWLRENARVEPLGNTGVIIHADEHGLAIIHHGRLINRSSRSGFSAANQGFDRDLEKMLSISVSDKNTDDSISTTGRFGLGFKSAYLVSDRPRIISGDYHFDIIAGMLPMDRDGDDEHPAAILVREVLSAPETATTIYLPFRASTTRAAVVGRLEQLAAFLPWTLLATSAVHLIGVGANTRFTKSWCYQSPNRLVTINAPTASAPQLLIFGKVHKPDSPRLVMAWSATGPNALASDVPTLWRTTPLRQPHGHGFLINASFAVDVGRGQVAVDESTNEVVVARAQDDLSAALWDFRQAICDDDEQMKLVENAGILMEQVCDPYGLLLNTLEAMTQKDLGEEGADRLIKMILWGDAEDGYSGGISRFLRQLGSLPSGLTSPFPESVPLADHLEAIDPQLLEMLPGQSFNATQGLRVINAQTVIPEVATLMGIAVTRMTLAAALGINTPGQTIDPQAAEMVSTALAGLATTNEHYQEVCRALQGKRLIMKVGTHIIGSQQGVVLLHSLMGEAEEAWRSIASSASLLDHRYPRAFETILGQAGVNTPNTEELSRWILNAEIDKRDSARTALEKADYPVRKYVNDHSAGTWLEDNDVEIPAPPPPPPNAWQKIAAWWAAESSIQLSKWEDKFYPSGSISIGWDIDNIANRKQWLTLFGLCLCNQIGRTKDVQNRDFMRILQSESILDRMADPDKSSEARLNAIRQLLDRYEDVIQSQEYTNWWPIILPLAVISRHLNDYVESLSELSKQERIDDLSPWFTPRINPHLQGVASAPPISKLLGMSKHILVRELVRAGLVPASVVGHLCWAPHDRVLKFAAWAAKPFDIVSAEHLVSAINRHIGPDYTFKDTFDIPLQILAADRDKQRRIIGACAPKAE